MSKNWRMICLAAIVAALTGPVFADDPAPRQGDMSQEIQSLRARLEQLELKQKQEDQKRRDAEQKLDERATADSLGREAVQRDQFLSAEGFTAGYSDNRFVIQSADGNFVLRPWAQLQFRGVVNDRVDFQGSAKHPEDEWNSGFEVRQLRIGIDGNMFSPDLTYFFNWATQRTSGNANVTSTTGSTKGTTIGTVSNNLGGGLLLQQAWAKYKIPATPFYVKAGQMKDPVLHEQIVDTRYQQGAERSLAADIFVNGDNYTEAVTFLYDPNENVRTEVGVNHGMRSSNTNFLSYPNNSPYNAFNYGFVGRAEYKVFGRWKDYNQVGAVGTADPLLVFGVGADYSERGRAGQLVAAADAMYADGNGLSIYGEVLDRYTTHNFGQYINSATGATIVAPPASVAGAATNEYAFVLEAGYIIDQHLEPFARYEYMKLQGIATTSKPWVQAFTGGVNYYFYGHRLKLTAEVVYLPDGLPFDDTASDVVAQPNGKSEISFVTQLQLAL